MTCRSSTQAPTTALREETGLSAQETLPSGKKEKQHLHQTAGVDGTGMDIVAVGGFGGRAPRRVGFEGGNLIELSTEWLSVEWSAF